VTYANHDNAPLASLYLHLRQEAEKDTDSAAARDLQALTTFAGFKGDLPDTLDDDLLKALQEALFRTRGKLAVLMCSDLIGVPLRFNLPGSYGRGTWSDRLELPLHELAKHPVHGPRITAVSGLIKETGRL
jgi:4-alpha-glucanotransferase